MSQSSLVSNTSIDSIINSWTRSKEGKFTEDQVIDAFLSGKQAGISHQDILLKNTFQTNFTAINEVLIKFFGEILKQDASAKLHLKISGFSNFEASILISEDFYLENKTVLFENATNIEQEVGSDILNLYINFLPVFGELNINALKADGFSLEYISES